MTVVEHEMRRDLHELPESHGESQGESRDESEDLEVLLARAREALEALGRVDLDALRDDELTTAVLDAEKLRCVLDVAEARVLARFETRGVWQPSGARNAAAWLAHRQRIPVGLARTRLSHARALRDLPVLEEAWASGSIERCHVAGLLACRSPRTEEDFTQSHEVLLDAARDCSFRTFTRICEYWRMHADPDGAEERAEKANAGRELHLSQSISNLWFLRGTLDPISGRILSDTLALIEGEFFEADWAEARERLGRDPLVSDLRRSAAQRRADALVEMAVRARMAPADGRRPAPLFSVVVDHESLAGPLLELFDRTVLTPGTLARHLLSAHLERIVFDGPSRVIDVGAKRRFFTGALRRAIEIRDRVCYHPTCDATPEVPEIDHIEPFSHGGPTTASNGRLACGFHNRWRIHHPDVDDDEERADDERADDEREDEVRVGA